MDWKLFGLFAMFFYRFRDVMVVLELGFEIDVLSIVDFLNLS